MHALATRAPSCSRGPARELSGSSGAGRASAQEHVEISVQVSSGYSSLLVHPAFEGPHWLVVPQLHGQPGWASCRSSLSSYYLVLRVMFARGDDTCGGPSPVLPRGETSEVLPAALQIPFSSASSGGNRDSWTERLKGPPPHPFIAGSPKLLASRVETGEIR